VLKTRASAAFGKEYRQANSSCFRVWLGKREDTNWAMHGNGRPLASSAFFHNNGKDTGKQVPRFRE
jgi:hypothetical protein